VDTWNDRLEAWVHEHPWSWGAWGAAAMGGFVLALQLFVDHRDPSDALPMAATLVALWFVALGVTAKRRARRS
jgi:hypothetical protein